MQTAIAERITEMVFADPEKLTQWLTRMVANGTVETTDEAFTVTNNAIGITGGTNFNTDPIGKAVIIAYCILGPLWAIAVPNLLECVKAEWKRQSKAKKQNSEED